MARAAGFWTFELGMEEESELDVVTSLLDVVTSLPDGLRRLPCCELAMATSGSST